MQTEVLIREESKFKTVTITSEDKPEISPEITSKWQNKIDLISEIIEVSSVLIMKINKTTMEVFLRNQNRSNPYEVGACEDLGSGLYCETVIGTDRELLIDNALDYEKWQDNPDVELDMISYYGLPLKWPDGETFGTICVLDNKTHNFTENHQKLIKEFKNTLEDNLKLLIYENQKNI